MTTKRRNFYLQRTLPWLSLGYTALLSLFAKTLGNAGILTKLDSC
jgi:hypothetical protein